MKMNKIKGYVAFKGENVKENDLILDPFMGSGTTAKIAQLMGREWVLIEAVNEYCDIARTRLESILNANSNN